MNLKSLLVHHRECQKPVYLFRIYLYEKAYSISMLEKQIEGLQGVGGAELHYNVICYLPTSITDDLYISLCQRIASDNVMFIHTDIPNGVSSTGYYTGLKYLIENCQNIDCITIRPTDMDKHENQFFIDTLRKSKITGVNYFKPGPTKSVISQTLSPYITYCNIINDNTDDLKNVLKYNSQRPTLRKIEAISVLMCYAGYAGKPRIHNTSDIKCYKSLLKIIAKCVISHTYSDHRPPLPPHLKIEFFIYNS